MASHSMLDPEERLLLLDALRPPEDYRLSFAIGTTYSLDLLALLTAPLGFTLFELAGPPGNELAPADAVRLLGVLRQYADRMTVFCEAGRIAVPPTHAILFGELEQIVVEVRPPEGRSFHPKVWVLRFEHEDKPVRYRLLCMTRNLTFDRSWDTMLALDGELIDRQRSIAVNHPLADFIQALPGMAKPGSVSERAHAQVATAADELRRVKFEPPEGFDDFAFHPLGLEPRRHPWPLERADRLLIMSPFLSDGLVDEIAAQAAESILISRPDTLDGISRSVFNNTRTVYSLSPDSTPVEPAGEETAHPDGITASGLHAKLYVAEIGRDARVLTGSANATHAAWYGNIEFLTELIGKRSKCGIDALLDGQDGSSSLRDFLVEYPVDAPGVEVGTDAAPWDDMLDAAQRILGAASWDATISQTDAGTFDVALASDVVGTPLERLALVARPVLLPSSSAQTLATESGRYVAAFEAITFEGLTSFFAIEVRPIDAPLSESRSFVVNARLIGEPADRRERRTQALLRDRDHVVRFLLMLLADLPEEIGSSTGSAELLDGKPWRGGGADGIALLEPLLRALDRNPQSLDQVASVIDDLRATEEGRAKLPPELESVWPPIWEARQALKERGSR